MKAPMKVEIYEQPDNAKLCAESCGVNWLLSENQGEARERLRVKFGDRVKIEFFDLASLKMGKKGKEILDRVKTQNLLLPLLMVNGHLRISGFFDIRMLIDVIDAQGEMGLG